MRFIELYDETVEQLNPLSYLLRLLARSHNLLDYRVHRSG